MHDLLRKRLVLLMRDSGKQGIVGALGLGVRGSAYIIMDMTSMQDEDLKKCDKPIPHFQHFTTTKTYLLIPSNLPTHELLLQNGLRICELAIWLAKHVELLRVIPIPRQYFRVLEPKLSSYCKKPAFFVHILEASAH
jgi:hypothetical protein